MRWVRARRVLRVHLLGLETERPAEFPLSLGGRSPFADLAAGREHDGRDERERREGNGNAQFTAKIRRLSCCLGADSQAACELVHTSDR
jgi:hypothetical protein